MRNSRESYIFAAMVVVAVLVGIALVVVMAIHHRSHSGGSSVPATTSVATQGTVAPEVTTEAPAIGTGGVPGAQTTPGVVVPPADVIAAKVGPLVTVLRPKPKSVAQRMASAPKTTEEGGIGADASDEVIVQYQHQFDSMKRRAVVFSSIPGVTERWAPKYEFGCAGIRRPASCAKAEQVIFVVNGVAEISEVAQPGECGLWYSIERDFVGGQTGPLRGALVSGDWKMECQVVSLRRFNVPAP